MKIKNKFIMDDLFMLVEDSHQKESLVQITINKALTKIDQLRVDYVFSEQIELTDEEETELKEAITDYALEYLTTNKPESLTNI